MPSPFPNLLSELDYPADLNLDRLRQKLTEAEALFLDYRIRAGLCEHELQSELRARVELAGPVPACPEPHHAFSLHGEDLIRARRDAAKKFNDVFRMTPVRRQN